VIFVRPSRPVQPHFSQLFYYLRRVIRDAMALLTAKVVANVGTHSGTQQTIAMRYIAPSFQVQSGTPPPPLFRDSAHISGVFSHRNSSVCMTNISL